MPSMASVTVKKYDGTTDIVYDALSAAGGDGFPAVWRQDTGVATSVPYGLRKVLKLQTQPNAPKTARQARINFVAPYAVQDSTTTVWTAKDRFVFDGVATMPLAIPPSEINEAAYQLGNLLAHLLIKQSIAGGYAPT